MSRENVRKFYDLVKTDERLAWELAKLKAEIEHGNEKFLNDDYVVNEKIIPLAKEHGFEFTVDELISYGEDLLAKLSADKLAEISGGVGTVGKSIASVFAFLSLAAPVVGGLSQSAFAGTDDDNATNVRNQRTGPSGAKSKTTKGELAEEIAILEAMINAKTQRDANRSNFNAQNTGLKTTKATRDELQKKLSTVTQQRGANRSNFNAQNTELKAISEALKKARIKADMEKLTNEISEFKLRNETLSKENAELAKAKITAESQNKELQKQIEELKKQAEEARKKAEDALKKQGEEIENLKGQLKEATKEKAAKEAVNAKLEQIKAQIKTNFDNKVKENEDEGLNKAKLEQIVKETAAALLQNDDELNIKFDENDAILTVEAKIPVGEGSNAVTATLKVSDFVKQLNDDVRSAFFDKYRFKIVTEEVLKEDLEYFKKYFIKYVWSVANSHIKANAGEAEKRKVKFSETLTQVKKELEKGIKIWCRNEEGRFFRRIAEKIGDNKWAISVLGRTDKGPVSYYEEVDMDADAELERIAEKARLSYTPFDRSFNTATSQAKHLLETLDQIDSLDEIKTKDVKKIKSDIYHLARQIKKDDAGQLYLSGKWKDGFGISQEGLQKILDFN